MMATNTEPSGSAGDQPKAQHVAVVIGTEEHDVRVFGSMPDARRAVRQWLRPSKAVEEASYSTTTGLLIEYWSDGDEEEYRIYELPIDKPLPERRKKRKAQKKVTRDYGETS